MADQPVRYRKLSGRSIGSSGVSRLWLGEDHLISESSVFGVESYQRFYLREIEALIIRRTKERLIWNCIFGGIVATGVAFGMLIRSITDRQVRAPATIWDFVVFAIFLGIPTVVALICLLINTFRGATCAVWVQTAGGTDRLRAPARIRDTRRVVNTISPLIEQAQTQTTGQSSARVSSPL